MPHRDEERIALLQRIAYGHGTSDVERVSAAAELEALREGVDASVMFHRREDTTGAPRVARAPTPAGPPAVARAASVEGAQVPAVSGPVLRWTLAATAVALVVGVVAGWSFGSRVAAEGSAELLPHAGSTDLSLPVGEILAAPVPFAEAPAMAVFDRAQTPADLPPAPGSVPTIDAASYRLLLIQPDGVSVHAARSIDGRDVCLAIVLPGGGMGSTCTADGMFPGDGVWMEVGDGGDAHRATWEPSGVVAVGAAG